MRARGRLAKMGRSPPERTRGDPVSARNPAVVAIRTHGVRSAGGPAHEACGLGSVRHGKVRC